MPLAKPALLGAAGAVALLGAAAYLMASAYTVGPPQCDPGTTCQTMVNLATSLAVGEMILGLPGFAGADVVARKPRLGGPLLVVGGLVLLAILAVLNVLVLLLAGVLWLAAGGLGLTAEPPPVPQVAPPATAPASGAPRSTTFVRMPPGGR